MLTGSGQAANFMAMFNIAGCGDHIVSSASIYGGSYNLLEHTLPNFGITATFVNIHDLAEVDMLADRIMVMHKGQIVEHGDADQIMQHPENPYTKKLLASLPVPDPREQQQPRAHLHEHLAQEA